MDYTTVFAGNDRPIGSLLTEIDSRLQHLAYVRSGGIVHAELDRSRGVFDEVDTEISRFEMLADVAGQVDDWLGAAVEYLHPSVGPVYVMLGRQPGAYLNAWVDVAERQLRRAIHDGEERRLYGALTAVADGCAAPVGVGDLEIPFEPRDPDDLAASLELSTRPGERGNTQLIVSLAPSAGAAELRARWGPGTRASRFESGYWVVETPEFRRFWSL